jgi:nucleoside-diphosphate-sugar epimerase
MFEIAGQHSKTDAMRVCWWKLFQPYGPDELPQRLVPSLIDSLLHRRIFEVQSPHDVRDFIHVDDVAGAVCASMAHRVGGTFDVGTGVGHRVGEIAELVAELLNADPLITLNDAVDSSRLHKPTLHIAHPQPLMAACDWQPIVDLRMGMARLIEKAQRKLKAIA